MDRLRRARRSKQSTSGVGPVKPSPFVLYKRSPHGLSVFTANKEALSFGIEPGLSLSDAKAAFPDVRFEEINHIADQKALIALAKWMVRFSPMVALDGEDGLLMETTGCDHLFDGEAAMAAEISRHISKAGYSHRIAIAGTPGAAHALARNTQADTYPVLSSGSEQEGLFNLPVSGLRISSEALTLLRRFGLTRIGQLYDIDRKALARRFQSRRSAHNICLRLDQALGRAGELLTPISAPSDYQERLPCPDPLMSSEGIQEGLRLLAKSLCSSLSNTGLGAHTFIFRAFLSDGSTSAITINVARPARNPGHIVRLFRDRINQIDPGFGIDLLTLEADRTSAMETGSPPLSGSLSESGFDSGAITELADRITARLGEGVITFTASEPRHPPQRTERRVPFTGTFTSSSARLLPGLRPIRMLQQPEQISVMSEVPDGPPLQFTWRRQLCKVEKADGPERISPEWWTWLSTTPCAPHIPPRARDYYRIEDCEGRRYWVFREGLYDDKRGSVPTWFMQGFLA